MKKLLFTLLLLPLLALAQTSPSDPASELRKLNWQHGPSKGLIGDKATIEVPKGYMFLGEADTKKFLEITGNLPESNNYFFGPENSSWWSVFSFNPTGYIKDDEKIDANDLLSKLKEGDISGNEERKKLGLKELFTEGWQLPPHYDLETKRLEWAVRLRSDNHINVNYTTRILGRTGVMEATLVGGTDTLTADSAAFKATLRQFEFNPGETYSEFKQGDKIAEYGLAALVLGGAAAVATKKGFWTVIVGFFAAFWKLIAAAVAAAVAGIGSLFKKKE